jgi:hypothetical protein
MQPSVGRKIKLPIANFFYKSNPVAITTPSFSDFAMPLSAIAPVDTPASEVMS